MAKRPSTFSLNECWSPHLRLTDLEPEPEPAPEEVQVEITATDAGPVAQATALRYSPLVEAPTLPPPLRETRRTRILNTQVALVEWETDLPSGLL